MVNSVYGSFLATEVLSGTSGTHRATVTVMEVLTTVTGPVISSFQAAEVLAEVTSPIYATASGLEVLCKVLDYPPYTPGLAVPWTIPPNWRDGITERLKWKTDVLTSQTGSEQRRKVRQTPRRDIEAKYLVYRKTRRLFENYMNGPAAALWRFPIWWERYHMTAGLSAGDHFIAMPDTTFSEFIAGDFVMIWADPFNYEIVRVLSVEQFGLPLFNSTSKSWPQGTLVFRTGLYRLIGTQQGQRMSDDVQEYTLTFESAEPQVQQTVVPQGTYNGVPYYLPVINEADNPRVEYKRILAEYDNEMGDILRRDVSGHAFRYQELFFQARNKQQSRYFIDILFTWQGRLVGFYYPTNFRDLTLAAPIGATDATITIDQQEYDVFGGPLNVGRNVIAIFFRDGTLAIRTISATVAQENGTEILAIDSGLGRNAGESDILRICFLQLVRQDQDEIEILHVTDTVVTFKTTVYTVELSRSASVYTTAYLGDYTQSDAPAVVVPDAPATSTVQTTVIEPVPFQVDTQTWSEGSGGANGGAF